MKLDKVDKKLLSYLYHNYREPLTRIAKACRISRDQVEYRLKKYEEKNIIKNYFTIFNFKAFNYNYFVVLFSKDKKEIKNIVSFGNIVGKYNYFFNVLFKNLNEFNEFLLKNDVDYFIVTKSSLFPLKIFEDKKEEIFDVNFEDTIKVKKEDYNLLKVLGSNSRAKIVELAKKSNMSSELILYKLKQLRKNKIILGSRIQFGMKELGFYFAVLRLKLNNVNEVKLKEYCKNSKLINSLNLGLSNNDYNCFIQFFYQDESELRTGIEDFKENFKVNIEKLEIIHVGEDEYINTLPNLENV